MKSEQREPNAGGRPDHATGAGEKGLDAPYRSTPWSQIAQIGLFLQRKRNRDARRALTAICRAHRCWMFGTSWPGTRNLDRDLSLVRMGLEGMLTRSHRLSEAAGKWRCAAGRAPVACLPLLLGEARSDALGIVLGIAACNLGLA